MKYIAVFGTLLVLSFWTFSEIHAWHHDKPVTPYGDFCPHCTKYGVCKTAMSHEDAESAMSEYYQKKGFNVELEKKRGRFIRANIKAKDNVIDVIIFDRQTGRIRSIY